MNEQIQVLGAGLSSVAGQSENGVAGVQTLYQRRAEVRWRTLAILSISCTAAGTSRAGHPGTQTPTPERCMRTGSLCETALSAFTWLQWGQP